MIEQPFEYWIERRISSDMEKCEIPWTYLGVLNKMSRADFVVLISDYLEEMKNA